MPFAGHRRSHGGKFEVPFAGHRRSHGGKQIVAHLEWCKQILAHWSGADRSWPTWSGGVLLRTRTAAPPSRLHWCRILWGPCGSFGDRAQEGAPHLWEDGGTTISSTLVPNPPDGITGHDDGDDDPDDGSAYGAGPIHYASAAAWLYVWSSRRVQGRVGLRRRHHAGRITSTVGLRVFRHSGLLSD